MSENRPPIYARCPAGCEWETMHKSDIESLLTYVRLQLDADGNIEVDPIAGYRIEAETLNGAYSCSLKLVYTTEAGGNQAEYNFEIAEHDEYRDYFFFEILSLTETDVTFEISGNRYTEELTGGVDLTADNKLVISGAVSVSKFNADAGTTLDPYKVFIKYADDEIGTNMTDVYSGQNYIGVYTGEVISELASDYTWAKFRGEDGKDGAKGEAGEAATITVGETTTGEAGTPAVVTQKGTAQNRTLDFQIPCGYSAGFDTPTATAEQLAEGAQPTATVEASGSDTAKVFKFKFGIPKTVLPPRIIEAVTVASTEWTVDDTILPFRYKATKDVKAELTDNIVISVDVDAIQQARSGIVIGGISGQTVTFYAVSAPLVTVTANLLLEEAIWQE